MPRVLFVDDEPLIRIALTDQLSASGFSVTPSATGADALAHVEQTVFDVAVLDLKLPDMSGIDVLRRIVELGSNTDVVMITAHGTIPAAVEAMKLGARDFLTKPFEASELLDVVRRYARVREARKERLSLPSAESSFHGMIGESAVMREMFRVIGAAAESNAPILIRGETGAGKQLVARAIHLCSARRGADFVVVSCALMRDGAFETARGGTLFLDEVADLPPTEQARLLHAIQTGEANCGRLAEVRFVASSRTDLRARAEQGSFREDLFYRLSVLPINVPPLRDRGEDVQLLADHFLWQHGAGGQGPPRRFSAGARNAMKHYAWPGNIRELQNAVARAVTLCSEECIESEHLALGKAPRVVPLASSVQAEEERRIDEALAQTGGRKAEAAELLGISRKTLWEKLKRRERS